jgi:hypothetical protein
MRKIFPLMLVLAPLLAACGKDGEPIIPELKGRWDVISLHKMTEQTMRQWTVGQATRVSNSSQPMFENCSVTYITFTKQGVVLTTLGIPMTVFPVAEAKRANARMILTAPGGGKIMLLMQNDELRFDDVIDPQGRSRRYERLPDGHQLRAKGANTIGEAFGLLLDLKPCKA